MTTLQLDLIERPAILFPDADLNAKLTARGPRTLDAAISGVWEDLGSQRVAACLVCGGTMVAHSDHGACADCGSTLS
jgi:hypothetical protein